MPYIDFNTILANNWDQDYHKTGRPVPVNAFMFGFVVLDWDGQFRKRLRKYKTRDLKIPFQYIEKVPDWQKGAQYNEISDIMGRFEPPAIYTNSTAQEFTMTLIYVAEALDSRTSSTPWTLEKIEDLVRRIQSFVFPQYDGQYSPPPKLLLNIGNIYKDVPVVIKQIQIENTEPFHVGTGISMTKKITLEFRASYPMWQGIKATDVYAAYEGNAGLGGPDVFAYERLDDRYLPRSKRVSKRQLYKGPFDNFGR
ncbi:hypothetical protein KY314_03150 [Candidatus Woesearchaeota archaeon]|nr:hypothetical protein [Candidatus Woesearchaeota archaeon]